LTKRPDRMLEFLGAHTRAVLPNVWLGTSVEDKRVLDRIDLLRLVPAAIRFISFEPLLGSVAEADLTSIDWAIVGGESGPSARPMRPQWVHEIECLCQSVGAKFFFKQWGGTNKKAAGRRYRGELRDDMPALRM